MVHSCRTIEARASSERSSKLTTKQQSPARGELTAILSCRSEPGGSMPSGVRPSSSRPSHAEKNVLPSVLPPQPSRSSPKAIMRVGAAVRCCGACRNAGAWNAAEATAHAAAAVNMRPSRLLKSSGPAVCEVCSRRVRRPRGCGSLCSRHRGRTEVTWTQRFGAGYM